MLLYVCDVLLHWLSIAVIININRFMSRLFSVWHGFIISGIISFLLVTSLVFVVRPSSLVSQIGLFAQIGFMHSFREAAAVTVTFIYWYCVA